MLPSIGIVPKLDPEFKEGNIAQSNIDAHKDFYTVVLFVAQGAGLTEEMQEYYREKFDINQPKKSKANLVRNFGEIKSDKDFEEKCVSHKKGCAIGLLPAMTIIDYEKENFEQHVNILKELDAEAKSHPIFYSWVNITCHPEWLKHFSID
jgi:hypothetical protein